MTATKIAPSFSTHDARGRRPRRSGPPVILAALVLVAGGWLASADAAAADDGERRAVARSPSSSASSSGSATSSGSSGRSSSARGSSSSSERQAVPRGGGDESSQPREGADRRTRSRGERHRGGVVVRVGGGWLPYWGIWGGPYYGWSGGWYGGPWISYDRYGGRGAYGGYPHRGGAAGALDLDISPEKAEIWLDGEYIGVADHFDGWPGYLWLEPGTYDLIFYKEGYETIARQYTIRPGVVTPVEDQMRQGQATRPEDLAPAPTRRRERRSASATDGSDGAGSDAPDWRERVRRERERRESEGARRSDDRPDRQTPGAYDARGDGARLVLDIEPKDAAVYLDGRFLGLAGELPREVLVDPGHHELAISRPGYGTVTEEVEAEAGEVEEVEIALERDSS